MKSLEQNMKGNFQDLEIRNYFLLGKIPKAQDTKAKNSQMKLYQTKNLLQSMKNNQQRKKQHIEYKKKLKPIYQKSDKYMDTYTYEYQNIWNPPETQ